MNRLIGLGVDATGQAHVPTVLRSGVNAVRLVLCQWDAHAGRSVDVGAVVARYATQGLAVLGVFALESLADESGRERSWEWALGDYAELVGMWLWGVQLGNEYSNPPIGASWTMTASDQSRLLELGAAAFLAVNPECAIVSGQIGTGQPSHLERLDLSPCSHVGVGLYDESVNGWPPDSFGDAETLLAGFAMEGGLPLIISEWSTTSDVAAPHYIPLSAAYYRSLPYVGGDFYFRYQDGGDDQRMGLFDAQGRPTARWGPFCQANQAQEGPMPDAILPDNAALAWGQRWRSLVPEAAYNHAFGLETTWRANAESWGLPLAETEQDFAYNGGTAAGRVFSKIGLVVWTPDKDAVVLGWP